MNKITLAFMLDVIDKNGLDDIVNFFKLKYDINDIVVFSKDPLLAAVDNSYGVLSLYYLKFYQGYVIFFRLEDYLEYQNYSLSKNIYLYLDNCALTNFFILFCSFVNYVFFIPIFINITRHKF